MELQCEFKNAVWENQQELYTCIIKNAVITEKATVIKAIKGNHIAKK
jgi:hypothetical protein